MKCIRKTAVICLHLLAVSSAFANNGYNDGLAFGSKTSSDPFSVFSESDLYNDIPYYDGDSPEETLINESEFVSKAGEAIDNDEMAAFSYMSAKTAYDDPYAIDRDGYLDSEEHIKDNADDIAGGDTYCSDGECYEYEEHPNEDLAS